MPLCFQELNVQEICYLKQKGARGIQKIWIINISCKRFKSELSIGNEKNAQINKL